jgi:hypothetical protein
MRQVARVFYYGYTLMLPGVGGSGVLIARWELPNIFAVDLSAMAAQPAATLLNQYRFLKSMELAFGLFCWLYRGPIWAGGQARVLVLAGVFAGVAARTVSLAMDGVPQWAFPVFAALELVCGLLMAIQPWRPA